MLKPSNCCCPPAKPGVYLTEINEDKILLGKEQKLTLCSMCRLPGMWLHRALMECHKKYKNNLKHTWLLC